MDLLFSSKHVDNSRYIERIYYIPQTNAHKLISATKGKNLTEERQLTFPKRGKSLIQQKPLAHLTPLEWLPRSQASPQSHFLRWCQWCGGTSCSRPCSTGYPVSLVSADLTWAPRLTYSPLAKAHCWFYFNQVWKYDESSWRLQIAFKRFMFRSVNMISYTSVMDVCAMT